MKPKKRHQQNKWKPIYRFLFLLLLAFVIGFILSYLIYLGYWYRFVDGLKTTSWYDYPLWFVLTFFITLVIHELGHLCAFLLQGVKIRALYLHMLVIYHALNGWKIAFKPKHWFLVGGFVVPDLGEVTDDESYQKLVHQFSRSLITAPIVTIVFMGVTILLFLLSILIPMNASTIGFITVFNLYTVIFSLLYIRSFKMSNRSFYGDFVAYKKMKEDTLFQLVQFLQYMQFSLRATEQTKAYLFNKTKMYLVDNDFSTTLFEQALLMNYMEMVCFHGFQDDEKIKEKLFKLKKNSLYRSENGILVLYDLAAYYYHLSDVEKSYHLLNEIKMKASQKIDEKLRTYLQYQFEHLLNVANHETYLKQEDHHVSSIADLFDVLMEDQEERQPLPFQVWESPVSFELIEEQKSDS
ncbi:MAG: site-2 protease family protein [Acholeplasmataceae bacterium]|nr:site-2 protease family protein [Acholeplasmataceae bacterium]